MGEEPEGDLTPLIPLTLPRALPCRPAPPDLTGGQRKAFDRQAGTLTVGTG